MTYDNTNSGIISRNDKGDNPNRPDYKGSLDVEGVQYWIAGWVRKRNSDGRPFLSIRIEKKEKQAAPSQPPENDTDADEQLPF